MNVPLCRALPSANSGIYAYGCFVASVITSITDD